MRSILLVLSLATGCYNAKHAEIPLRGNPDGADCFLRCRAADESTRMACVAACPAAQVSGGTCSAEAGPACAQVRTFSGWKTAGCVALGLLVVGALTQGGAAE